VAAFFAFVAVGSLVIAPVASADDSLPPPTVASGEESAQFTPIISQLVTAPVPFKADDGLQHLAFELLLTNSSPRTATVTSVLISPVSSPQVTLQALKGKSEVAASMIPVGDLTIGRNAAIAPQATSELLLDAIIPAGMAVPGAITVTLTATFAAPKPGQPPYVSIFPDSVTEVLPRVSVSKAKTIVVRPPLAGGDWVAMNACCELSAHRGAMLGASARPLFPERYAIDFVRMDASGNLYKPGKAPSMGNNYSYDAKLLAVAPATVVAVQKGIPDQPPGVNPTGYSLEQLGGDYVVLKLRPGLYAFYAHISPDSIAVEVGQKVKAGQVLGLLGNSGNSTAPHLHFQLINGPGPLTSDGVPYEFTSFKVVARPSGKGDSFAPVSPPVSLVNAYPLTNTVVRFSGTSGALVDSGSAIPSPGVAPAS